MYIHPQSPFSALPPFPARTLGPIARPSQAGDRSRGRPPVSDTPSGLEGGNQGGGKKEPALVRSHLPLLQLRSVPSIVRLLLLYSFL